MSFCSVPEHALAAAAANVCQWPRGHVITWTIVEKLRQFTDDEYRDAIAMGWCCGSLRVACVSSTSLAPMRTVCSTCGRLMGRLESWPRRNCPVVPLLLRMQMLVRYWRQVCQRHKPSRQDIGSCRSRRP